MNVFGIGMAASGSTVATFTSGRLRIAAVRAEILQRFPGVSVELYFARFEGEQAVFETLS